MFIRCEKSAFDHRKYIEELNFHSEFCTYNRYFVVLKTAVNVEKVGQVIKGSE